MPLSLLSGPNPVSHTHSEAPKHMMQPFALTSSWGSLPGLASGLVESGITDPSPLRRKRAAALSLPPLPDIGATSADSQWRRRASLTLADLKRAARHDARMYGGVSSVGGSSVKNPRTSAAKSPIVTTVAPVWRNGPGATPPPSAGSLQVTVLHCLDLVHPDPAYSLKKQKLRRPFVTVEVGSQTSQSLPPCCVLGVGKKQDTYFGRGMPGSTFEFTVHPKQPAADNAVRISVRLPPPTIDDEHSECRVLIGAVELPIDNWELLTVERERMLELEVCSPLPSKARQGDEMWRQTGIVTVKLIFTPSENPMATVSTDTKEQPGSSGSAHLQVGTGVVHSSTLLRGYTCCVNIC